MNWSPTLRGLTEQFTLDKKEGEHRKEDKWEQQWEYSENKEGGQKKEEGEERELYGKMGRRGKDW